MYVKVKFCLYLKGGKKCINFRKFGFKQTCLVFFKLRERILSGGCIEISLQECWVKYAS